MPAGSGFFVLVIDAANLFIPNAQEATCPAFTYSIAVDPGSYFLRVEVLTLDGIDALPWRTLSAGPISVEGSNVEQNIQIVEGTPSGDMSRWMESRYRM